MSQDGCAHAISYKSPFDVIPPHAKAQYPMPRTWAAWRPEPTRAASAWGSALARLGPSSLGKSLGGRFTASFLFAMPPAWIKGRHFHQFAHTLMPDPRYPISNQGDRRPGVRADLLTTRRRCSPFRWRHNLCKSGGMLAQHTLRSANRAHFGAVRHPRRCVPWFFVDGIGTNPHRNGAALDILILLYLPASLRRSLASGMLSATCLPALRPQPKRSKWF